MLYGSVKNTTQWNMLTLEEIQQEMEIGQMAPSRAAELRVIVTGKYARARDEFDTLETMMYAFLNDRPEEDAEAAKLREWNGTKEGESWRHWKSKMKKTDRMGNSLSSVVKTAEGEMRGQI